MPAPATRRAAVPRQHGAWAMLATPLLLGVASSQLDPWQFVVAIAAVSGYLLSSTAQAWLRARRSSAYRRRLAISGAVFGVSGLALVLAWPALLASLLVLLPATLVTLGGARPGTPRDLANSLAQVAQAVVLVPVTAWVSGAWDGGVVTAMTILAAAFLTGEVFVVRSVLRERGSRRFATLSVGYHVAFAFGVALILPVPYVILASLLLLRATLLPLLQGRLAGTDHPLRPIHVGLLELACSVVLVLVAFVVPL